MHTAPHAKEKTSGRKKIGVALGSGGARGLAHIGVIKYLELSGIPIDYIAGTSMGALVGGFYAATEDIRALEDAFLRVKRKDMVPIGSMMRKRDGLMFRDPDLVRLLEERLKNATVEGCKIPFRAIATDVKNGDEVVLKAGHLEEAIRASVALPVIFHPVPHASRLVMDGGFSNPIPADVVRAMGADFVVAVDVSSEWLDVSDGNVNIVDLYRALPNVISALEYQLSRRILKEADLVIRPPVLHHQWFDFHRAEEIIDAGRDEMHLHIKEVRAHAKYPAPPKTFAEKFFDFLADTGT